MSNTATHDNTQKKAILVFTAGPSCAARGGDNWLETDA
jgi:hypothetical protein